MHRQQYDTDVTVWAPTGRLHQVEYAMNAVQWGSAVLGLRSDKFVVLAAIKRRSENSELASYTRKLFKIDNHLGMAMSGLTADARSLARYMRTESLNHQYVYGTPIAAGRLVGDVADKHQRCTQTYVRRPYGVGLLVAGYDQTGPHLYQTCPSGQYYEYYATALGHRAQSAKTYLEKHYENLEGLDADTLIKHALRALSGCKQGDGKDGENEELDVESTSISIVGEGREFEFIEGADLQRYLDEIEVEDGAGAEAKDGDAMETTEG